MPNPTPPIPPSTPRPPGPSRPHRLPPLPALGLAPLLLACLVLLAHAASAQLPAVATQIALDSALPQNTTTGTSPTPTPICGLAWSVVSSPNAPGSTDSRLFWMGAVSPNDVWAVGRYDSNGVARTLALHWDGSQWAQITTPNRGSGTTDNLLIDVAGVSTDDVWAVGYNDGPGGADHTLAEHWDGSQWSIVPSPSFTTTDTLRSVSALSSNNVWAAGYYLERDGPFAYSRTLVEHWDGSQWSIVPSPNTGLDAEFWSVSALSPNDVWAVGGYATQDGHSHTLVEHWDGSQWSIVPSPDPSDPVLFGVTAIAANDVWAVGTWFQSPASVTLTMHWDGVRWSMVPSPNLGPRTNELTDVSAISASDVWAVGQYCCDSGRGSVTLAMHWDGSQWSIVSSPNPGNVNNSLRGVAALSTGDVWAVGTIQHCGGGAAPG